MSIMRRAGVAGMLCLTVLLPAAPAGASSQGLFDEPTPTVQTCGISAYTGSTNVSLPCPANVAQYWGDVVYYLDDFLTGVALLPIAAIAETYADTYIGAPLEGVPFFGNGLAALARSVIVVPAQLFEWTYDTFIYPVLGWVLQLVDGIGGWIGRAIDLALGVLWLLAMHFASFIGAASFAFFGLIDTGLRSLEGALGDIGDGVLGVLIYPEDVTELLQSMDALRINVVAAVFSLLDLVGALSIEDSSTLPVGMPGGVSVDVLAVFDTMPSGLELLVQVFVGFWLVFAAVQAIGAMARMTDAS
jgi:hypothetical protein